jgi:ATP-binding cassette subfamily B (MDR/TAP) protein 1
MLLIFGGGGGYIAKLAGRVVSEYSAAATIAEEVLSSIRTAQAFGTEEKLAKQYDTSLIAAQKVGYRKAGVIALMFAGIFTLVYLSYGLAFCTSPPPSKTLFPSFLVFTCFCLASDVYAG